MNAIVERFRSEVKTRDEARQLIKNFEDDFRKGNKLMPVAVCFSLEEMHKLLNHASVALDIKGVKETEKGIAFYFVSDSGGGEASILMSIAQVNDADGDGRFGNNIGEFNDEIVTKGFIADVAPKLFNLLDVGTKHP